MQTIDKVLIGWFAVNLVLVVYMFDVEQIVIADPSNFEYPIWPPGPLIDAIHAWGENYDPLLMARPAWFRFMIWLDIVAFGPFYAAAIYAFVTRRNWIRLPAVMYATAMLVHLGVIFFEQFAGPHPAPVPAITLLVYGPYVLGPLLVLWRMWPGPPFDDDVDEG